MRIDAVARRAGPTGDILFGRLCCHLDARHRYSQDDGSKVHLFAPRVGDMRHAVNFPLLAAVLAERQVDDWRFQRNLWVAIAALGVSIAALVVSILAPLR